MIFITTIIVFLSLVISLNLIIKRGVAILSLLLFLPFFSNGQEKKVNYYFDFDFLNAGCGIMANYQNRMTFGLQTGVAFEIDFNPKRFEHTFAYSPYLKTDLGLFLFKGKRPMSGLSLETYYVFARKYDADFGGWINKELLPYDIWNVTFNYSHFFGKSNFYYEFVVGMAAYSYRGSDYNNLSPIIYPNIGYRKELRI